MFFNNLTKLLYALNNTENFGDQISLSWCTCYFTKKQSLVDQSYQKTSIRCISRAHSEQLMEARYPASSSVVMDPSWFLSISANQAQQPSLVRLRSGREAVRASNQGLSSPEVSQPSWSESYFSKIDWAIALKSVIYLYLFV